MAALTHTVGVGDAFVVQKNQGGAGDERIENAVGHWITLSSTTKGQMRPY